MDARDSDHPAPRRGGVVDRTAGPASAERRGASGRSLPPSLLNLLVVTIFATAGTIHYQSPMLGQIGAEFGVGPAAVGWIPTLTFAGFLTGSLLLTPLGDRYDKRTLILAILSMLIVGIAGMGLAPSLPLLIAAGFVVGLGACVSQQVIPMVVGLAPPASRGRVVGTLMSGLFVGILAARVGSGLVAAHLGWRWIYAISGLLLLGVLAALVRRLPRVPPSVSLSYRALLASLLELLRTRADLRRASAIQFLLGICYGGFWATLAAMLLAEHGLGPAAAGLVGVPGAAGILIARPAGGWTDRHGAGPVVAVGAALVVVAFVVLGFARWWVAPVVLGAALLDCGLRAAMVANQTLVASAVPEARSRMNTVFAVHIWGGNASGAAIASIAYATRGWIAVCAVAALAAGAAFVVQEAARRRG